MSRRLATVIAIGGTLLLGLVVTGSRTNCVPVEPTEPVCEGENPQGCVDTGCPEGEVCTMTLGLCVPSSCVCDEEAGAWICTDDCGGGVCVPDTSPCAGPNPQGCVSTGCPDGERCVQAPDQCVPSACGCDPSVGAWTCTADCSGGVCVPDDGACDEPNPAGCVSTGCPMGQACVQDPSQCVPSSCVCDPATGVWACTEDCGGGVCVATP